MKNKATGFVFILCIFFSCLSCKKENNNFLIHGKIQNAKSEFYAVYPSLDENFLIDTIPIAADGKFEIRGKTDSLLIVMLSENKNNWISIFVNSGYNVTVNGDFSCLSLANVKGGKYNNELKAFKSQIKDELKQKYEIEQAIKKAFYEENDGGELLFSEQILPTLKNVDHSLMVHAEYFIKEDPGRMSNASILLDYFCRDSKRYKLQYFLSILETPVKDYYITNFLRGLSKKMEQAKVGNKASDFVLQDTLKNNVSLADFSGQYVLLHFWASDDLYSRLHNRYYLNDVLQLHLNKLSILGVSLDKDKATWKQSLRHDNMRWTNVCDFDGVNSAMAHSYGIFRGNKNFLINPDGIIIAQDIRPEDVKPLMQRQEEIYASSNK